MTGHGESLRDGARREPDVDVTCTRMQRAEDQQAQTWDSHAQLPGIWRSA